MSKKSEDYGVMLESQLTPAPDRINPDEWAGGIPHEMATLPQVRIGKRWLSPTQTALIVILGGTAALIVAIVAARWLRSLSATQAFIARYPGVGDFGPPVEGGFPLWLRLQHYFNFIFLLFIIRSGLQILADHPRLTLDASCAPDSEFFRLRGPVPKDRSWTAKDDSVGLPGWLGLPGLRHTIGLARWWHFSVDLFWVVNGVIFYVLLFSTGQWQRLIPQSWDVFAQAASVFVQYLSLDFPPHTGWARYDALQMLAYFVTVFIAAPLAAITGLLQSPAIAAKFKTGTGLLNRQIARSVHFGILVYFVGFLIVHVIMVLSTGALFNINYITRGANSQSLAGVWLLLAGLLAAAAVWIAATPFTLRYPRVVQRVGHVLVDGIKSGMERWTPTAEYTEADISPYFWVNGTHPDSEEYHRLAANGFQDFKLKVGGLVENPAAISFEQIKKLKKQQQITQHYCIQGWSGIAKWGGASMRDIMDIVRPHPEARFVVFYSFARGPEADSGLYYDAHPIENMNHKQSILAYEMNDKPLPEPYGAPLRVRDEIELGFKQVKWVQAIEFVESYAHLGSGEGGFNEDHEFFDWHASI